MDRGLEYIIVIIGVVFTLTYVSIFILSYYVYEHVAYLLPYISDSGSFPPESCYFAQSQNIIWVLVSFTVYLKYGQIKYIVLKKTTSGVKRLNTFALIMGLLASFGLSIVGNFQQPNFPVMHWIGATLVFGFGSVYISIMTSIYKSLSMYFNKNLIVLRYILCVVALTSWILYFITGLVSYSQFDGDSYFRWTKDVGGYGIHQVSTIGEWINCGSIGLYFSLYFWEFKQMSVSEPVITFNVPGLQANLEVNS